MKKYKIRVIVLIIILALIPIISMLIYKSGVTKSLFGLASGKNIIYDSESYINYPKINYVYNSSGEKIINNDVTLTIDVQSISSITNLQYSYNLKKWKDIKIKKDLKEINKKLIFKKTMNKTIYIRVINEKGYKSYPYKTKVIIDKIKPTIKLRKLANYRFILQDNYNLKYVQYSNDLKKWETEEVTSKKSIISKQLMPYNYVRCVDEAGNISEILNIN